MEYKIERWQKKEKPDARKLRGILETEGFRVYQWQDAPDVFYPNHRHSSDQSHWIISGELELTIENEKTYALRAGDRDFMPANTVHSARVVSDEPVVYLIGEKNI